jgi:hypothetical protein
MFNFLTKNSNFWSSLQGLEVEHVVLFYAHFECINSVWYILRPYSNMLVLWLFSHRFGILCRVKSDNLVREIGPLPDHWNSTETRKRFLRLRIE